MPSWMLISSICVTWDLLLFWSYCGLDQWEGRRGSYWLEDTAVWVLLWWRSCRSLVIHEMQTMPAIIWTERTLKELVWSLSLPVGWVAVSVRIWHFSVVVLKVSIVLTLCYIMNFDIVVNHILINFVLGEENVGHVSWFFAWQKWRCYFRDQEDLEVHGIL